MTPLQFGSSWVSSSFTAPVSHPTRSSFLGHNFYFHTDLAVAAAEVVRACCALHAFPVDLLLPLMPLLRRRRHIGRLLCFGTILVRRKSVLLGLSELIGIGCRGSADWSTAVSVTSHRSVSTVSSKSLSFFPPVHAGFVKKADNHTQPSQRGASPTSSPPVCLSPSDRLRTTPFRVAVAAGVALCLLSYAQLVHVQSSQLPAAHIPAVSASAKVRARPKTAFSSCLQPAV